MPKQPQPVPTAPQNRHPFALSNESSKSMEELVAGVVARYQPQNVIEREVCYEIAWAMARMRRARVIEGGLIDLEMDLRNETLCETLENFDEGTRLADSFKSLAEKSPALQLLLRYGARARRDLERSISLLERLRKPAPDQPPAPEPEKQIRQNEPEPPATKPANSAPNGSPKSAPRYPEENRLPSFRPCSTSESVHHSVPKQTCTVMFQGWPTMDN